MNDLAFIVAIGVLTFKLVLLAIGACAIAAGTILMMNARQSIVARRSAPVSTNITAELAAVNLQQEKLNWLESRRRKRKQLR